MRRLASLGLAAIAALLPASAAAWEFRPLPVCTVDHEGPEGAVRMTYDPATGTYAIALTRPEPWPAAPVFAIRFDGGRTLTISTTRHVLSGDGRTLTVTDRGFGNVLNGLQFNASATGLVEGAAMTVGLLGATPAAPAVEAFRACAAAPSV